MRTLLLALAVSLGMTACAPAQEPADRIADLLSPAL